MSVPRPPFIDSGRLQQQSLMDLQRAYDTFQHDLLWACLDIVGVGPGLLAAIESFISAVMTCGQSRAFPGPAEWGAAGVLPQSHSVWHLFDGLHGHWECCAPHAGMQLGSGRWISLV